MTLLCAFCFGPIESFEELHIDDSGNDFHDDCPHVVRFSTDLEDEF